MPNSQFINLNINQERYVNKTHSFSRIQDLIEIGGSSDVLVEMGKHDENGGPSIRIYDTSNLKFT